MVLQPPLIFPISLRDNLAYGRPDATHRRLLAPEPIPVFLFAEGRNAFGEPLSSALRR